MARRIGRWTWDGRTARAWAAGRLPPSAGRGWRVARARRDRPRGVNRPLFATWASTVLLTLFSLGLMLVVGVGSVAASVYAGVTRDLPAVSQLASREPFQTTRIYDRNGVLLHEFYAPNEGRRTLVPLAEISPWLLDATLAAEDANFYGNPGVDPHGVARAIWQNLSHHGIVSGASTITQQLVRNTLIPEDERERQTLLRKFEEAVLAYRVNEMYSKDDVLDMYLNEVYYGDQAYGVAAAAQTYFGKTPRDLTLAEASMLAGLPQSPSDYNPRLHYEAARERQHYVLDQMVRSGFIDQATADNAWAQEPTLAPPPDDEIKAPHWVFYIRDMLEQKYGPRLLYQGGLRVYTTLDLRLQERLEQVARDNADNLRLHGATNTGLVAIDPKTGEILAMVGSLDYHNAAIDGQVNVTTSLRQPGSSIKPVVYLTAFEKAGFTPATVVPDEPKCFPGGQGQPPYCPVNYDHKFHGPVPVRVALGNSLNLPAVETLNTVGVPNAVEMANRLGITSLDPSKQYGLSLTLGGVEVTPLELAGAYATFANQGRRVGPVAVRRIVDGHDRIIEEERPTNGEQVVDPRLAYMLTNVLSDPNARLITYGPHSGLELSRPAAAKTGTTDNYRDTWTMGYTPNLTIGVWVGNTDGHPMREVLSSMSAGKIWHEAMEAAFQVLDLPVEDFQRPDGLVDVPVSNEPGHSTDLALAERPPRR